MFERFERLINELVGRRPPRAAGVQEYIKGGPVHVRFLSLATISDQQRDQGEATLAKGPLTRQKRKVVCSIITCYSCTSRGHPLTSPIPKKRKRLIKLLKRLTSSGVVTIDEVISTPILSVAVIIRPIATMASSDLSSSHLTANVSPIISSATRVIPLTF